MMQTDGLDRAVPWWLTWLRAADYRVDRIPEPYRARVQTALRWHQIQLLRHG